MFDCRFGTEIEFTGITRMQAAKTAQEVLGGSLRELRDNYDSKVVKADDGREWKFCSDSSIIPHKKQNGQIVGADYTYRVELVSPILRYRDDIGILQTLIRKLRKAGGFTTHGNCGIHVHLDGANHTPRSIRNFINIIASKNDLLYKALQIDPGRMQYCKKMDLRMVDRMKRRKPTTFEQIANIWYEGYGGNRHVHYHDSRYHLFYG